MGTCLILFSFHPSFLCFSMHGWKMGMQRNFWDQALSGEWLVFLRLNSKYSGGCAVLDRFVGPKQVWLYVPLSRRNHGEGIRSRMGTATWCVSAASHRWPHRGSWIPQAGLRSRGESHWTRQGPVDRSEGGLNGGERVPDRTSDDLVGDQQHGTVESLET